MKRTFTLLSSLFLMIGTMWAQTVVTAINTDKYYTLECRSGYAHNTNRFIGDNGTVINGQAATATFLKFEAAEGGYYIYSMASERYLNSDGNTVTASADTKTVWKLNAPTHTAGVVTFEVATATDKYLNNNGTKSDGTCTALQPNSHSGGPGAGNACSLWEMCEYDEVLASYDITYNFTYEGQTIATQEVTVTEGDAYPDYSVVLPYGVAAAAKPEGNVTETKTIEVALTVDAEKALPVEAAETVEGITKWYFVKLHSTPNYGRKYIQALEDGTIEWADTEVAEGEEESHLWGFVGDVWGMKLVSKTGKAVVSTSGDALLGDAAQATAFVVTASSADESGFCMQYPDKNYLNGQGGAVKSWSANDAGSTFLVELYEAPVVDLNDYTSYIKNADLSTSYAEGATSADWDITNTKGISGGMVKVGSGKTFDFSQTITLPAGQYKMTAKAAYRYGSDEAAEYAAIEAGSDTHLAKLYAATASYKYEVDVMNRYEGASDTDYAAGNGSVTVNGKFVPNSSDAVKAWFDADQYVNELVFNVQEEGEVKIGIAKDVESSDYTNIGAWTLTRLGDAEDDPQVEEDFVYEDFTDKVSTSKDAWQGNNGGPITIDGISMPEKYEGTTETLGDVMWQTVTDLENGIYIVELWANARYTPGRMYATAFDGEENCTFLFANNVEKSIPVIHNADLNNNTSHRLVGVEVTDGTLKMGMTKKAAGSNWHSIQIKSLTYTTIEAVLAEVKKELRAVIDAATAVPATEELTAAIATAQGVLGASANVNELIDAAATLNAATTLAVNTNAVAGATIASPVVTDFVVNGTFDTKTAPWKTTTKAANQQIANNQEGAFTKPFFENWNGDNYTGKIYQVIENIPNGLYELSICAFVGTHDASAQYIYANDDKKALITGAPTAYTVRTIVTDNKIEIGFEQTAAVNNWSGIDNVSLKFFGLVGEDYALEIYKSTKAAAEALTTKKMSPEALAALNEALTTEIDETDDEALLAAEVALQEVMTTAQASVDFFASNKTAIDAMFTLMQSTNVYTVEAYEAYSAKAEDFLAQYEAGTLTATVDNPAAIHGWHADVDYDDFLFSAFGTHNIDDAFHINTWSTEGEVDGSEFKVPFFEYWTGDDGTLGVATKTATVTGLTPGQEYHVNAWVRVRAKNGVDAAEATGITLTVGDGEAVDVTEGEVVGTSQFSHAEYTAKGTADAEGKLTISFNILEGNNISWLSFKNLNYKEAPAVLPVLGAKVGDVAIVDGTATVTSISTIDVIFDRPVAKAEGAGWATLADKWDNNTLQVQVLEAEEGSSEYVVRFSVWDWMGEFTEAGDYILTIPEGLIIGAEDANYINETITATITIEASASTSLTVTNVTVGEDVMEGLTAVATPADMIKVNFDGQFYFQGMPSIVDAEGNDASEYFQWMNGTDVDGSNSYIFMAQNWQETAAPAGVYTITLPKASFMGMMQFKAPAEDIVLTVQITTGDEEPEIVEVTAITLNKTQVEFSKAGDTFQLEATVVPENATNKAIEWKSSNEDVATVSEDGVITAVGDGMAEITVTAENGVKATCYVIVEIISDGIDNINANAETVIYDIHGRRVTEMTKGVYIVNGKKVVKK